ncbi:MAG: LysE family translocator [Geminicoccaceae bacterium]
MSLELWLAFVVAASVLLLIPGPTIVYVVALGLTKGRATAMRAVPGVVAGDLVAMTLSLAGVGTILALSSTLYSAVKLGGAIYLVWIGITLWRQAPELQSLSADIRSTTIVRPAMQAFWVTVLNPKSILFFIAFMPQFIASARPILPQFVLLGLTFLVLAGLNIAAYAWLSGAVAARVTPRARARFQRGGALCLMAAGLYSIWTEAGARWRAA